MAAERFMDVAQKLRWFADFCRSESTAQLMRESAEEIESLQRQVASLCDRVAAQSELLSRCAEKGPGQ